MYSSSVTDAEWAILEPLLPAPGSPRRHRLTADDYRSEMADRLATWNDITRSSEAA